MDYETFQKLRNLLIMLFFTTGFSIGYFISQVII